MNATHETNGRPTTQNISRELYLAELRLAAQVDAASAQAATICENGGALDLAVGRYAREVMSAQERLATAARAVHQMAGSLLSSLTGTLEGLQGMFAPFEVQAAPEPIGRAGAPRFQGSLLPLDTMGPEEQQEFADDSPPWGDDGLPDAIEDAPQDTETNYPLPPPVARPPVPAPEEGRLSITKMEDILNAARPMLDDEPDANTPPPADEPAPVPAPEEAKEEQEHTFTESQKDSVSRAFEDLEEPGPHGGDHEDEVKHEVEAIDRDEAGAAVQPQKKARKRKQR